MGGGVLNMPPISPLVVDKSLSRSTNQPFILLELFGGILPVAVVAQMLQCDPIAHFFSEIDPDALTVASDRWPDAINLGDINEITSNTLLRLTEKFPEAKWFVSGGPPCTDVSLLKTHRAGANGPQSGLRNEFKRIYSILCSLRPNKVFALMECTPMLEVDKDHYDGVFGKEFPPFELCSSWWTPVTRKRWWWLNFNPIFPPEVAQTKQPNGVVKLSFHPDNCPVRLPLTSVIQPNWIVMGLKEGHPESSFNFNCLTRHLPKLLPGQDPRG
jgi:hypothetical protein